MLTDSDWAAIYNAIRESKGLPEMTFGVVTASDDHLKAVKVAEFGDEWIPMFGFQGTVKVYDEGADGVTRLKTAQFIPAAPEVGSLVLILRQFGSRRLPKCIGTYLSKEL